MFSPGIEPGTFRVLGGCDNHYTTETTYLRKLIFEISIKVMLLRQLNQGNIGDDYLLFMGATIFQLYLFSLKGA